MRLSQSIKNKYKEAVDYEEFLQVNLFQLEYWIENGLADEQDKAEYKYCMRKIKAATEEQMQGIFIPIGNFYYSGT